MNDLNGCVQDRLTVCIKDEEANGLSEEEEVDEIGSVESQNEPLHLDIAIHWRQFFSRH